MKERMEATMALVEALKLDVQSRIVVSGVGVIV